MTVTAQVILLLISSLSNIRFEHFRKRLKNTACFTLIQRPFSVDRCCSFLSYDNNVLKILFVDIRFIILTVINLPSSRQAENLKKYAYKQVVLGWNQNCLLLLEKKNKVMHPLSAAHLKKKKLTPREHAVVPGVIFVFSENIITEEIGYFLFLFYFTFSSFFFLIISLSPSCSFSPLRLSPVVLPWSIEQPAVGEKEIQSSSLYSMLFFEILLYCYNLIKFKNLKTSCSTRLVNIKIWKCEKKGVTCYIFLVDVAKFDLPKACTCVCVWIPLMLYGACMITVPLSGMVMYSIVEYMYCTCLSCFSFFSS